LIDFKYIKNVIEALLFASDVPLTINRLVKVLENIKESDILKAIDELNSEYDASGRSFRVRKIGGGYQLVTNPEFSKYIKILYKGRVRSRLSQAALEALSIIAFKQPISRPEIDQIRGVNSDGVVKTLLERNLISLAGRSDSLGRALLYGTTDEFLRYFGINSIEDLPRPKELEELLGATQEEFKFPLEGDKSEIIDSLTNVDDESLTDAPAK